MKKFLLGVAPFIFLLTLVGCGSIGNNQEVLSSKLVDKVVPVADEYRAVRVCLMAAGIVEVMTDRVQVFDSSQAPEAFGRLQALQGAVENARLANPLWLNTDMTDVALKLAAILKEAGRERLSRILFRGPTVANFVNVANRSTMLSAKGDAIILDINNMLEGVSMGILNEQTVWEACRERINKNRIVLSILSGVAVR